MSESADRRSNPIADRFRWTWVATVAAQHHGVVLAIATAVAFGYAKVTVAILSWQLGISPTDLGLNTQDLLALSAGWVAVMLIVFGLYWLQQLTVDPLPRGQAWGWQRRLGRFVVGVAATGVAGVLIVSLRPSSLLQFLLLYGGAYVGALLVLIAVRWALGSNLNSSVISAGAMALTVASVGCMSTWFAADRLRDQPFEYPGLPLPMSLILAPQEGEVTVGGRVYCVLRVSPKVAVADGFVLVAEFERFRTRDC